MAIQIAELRAWGRREGGVRVITLGLRVQRRERRATAREHARAHAAATHDTKIDSSQKKAAMIVRMSRAERREAYARRRIADGA